MYDVTTRVLVDRRLAGEHDRVLTDTTTKHTRRASHEDVWRNVDRTMSRVKREDIVDSRADEATERANVAFTGIDAKRTDATGESETVLNDADERNSTVTRQREGSVRQQERAMKRTRAPSPVRNGPLRVKMRIVTQQDTRKRDEDNDEDDDEEEEDL